MMHSPIIYELAPNKRSLQVGGRLICLCDARKPCLLTAVEELMLKKCHGRHRETDLLATTVLTHRHLCIPVLKTIIQRILHIVKVARQLSHRQRSLQPLAEWYSFEHNLSCSRINLNVDILHWF